MRRFLCFLALAILLLGAANLPAATAFAQPESQPVVKAVLFYSPTCPHCHTVINDTLLPLIEQYGDSFQVIGIDITQAGGQTLYNASTERFQIPQEMSGVPRLIVGDAVLIGSIQIPQELPGIIEAGLAEGGIDWPDIPGLAEGLAAGQQQAEQETATEAATAAPTAESNTPAPTTAPTQVPTTEPTAEVVAIDSNSLPPAGAAAGIPDGGWLAAVILAGMLLALVFAAIRVYSARAQVFSAGNPKSPAAISPLIPILALAGLGVSIYLAYVEITQTAAVCGPVGECNVVQSSDYASIAGIPVAVLGVANYVAILGLWAVQRLDRRHQRWMAWALLLLTLFGVLFSVYLTLLELFVIHAVCIWCLTSAVITTALMLVVVLQLAAAPRSSHPPRRQPALPA